MTSDVGTMSLSEAATTLAGNWKRFNSFGWGRLREIPDPDNWAIVYTSNRDSRLLDQSNAAVFERVLTPFTEGDDPDIVFESHGHWAVGHVDGFSVRVFRNGEVTPAFAAYHALAERYANYAVLDESDYSEREYEATLDNIKAAAWRVKNEFELPDGWEGEVYSWLSGNNCHAIENRDDQGGYPEEDELREAFDALGYPSTADETEELP